MARSDAHGPARGSSPLGRGIIFVYGVLGYLSFYATFLYMFGFVGNFIVPKSIDAAGVGPLDQALAVNSALLGLFALQHSVMARHTFKKWGGKFVPPPAERTTFVLSASGLLMLLFWQWRPIPTIVWQVDAGAGQVILRALFVVGWLVVFLMTLVMDHFDFTGLRQSYGYLQGKQYVPMSFRTPALYKRVRHPIYLGLLIAFWATPVMTWGHLIFALGMTAYILLGICWEEQDLLRSYGKAYQQYRQRVPMIIPSLRKR